MTKNTFSDFKSTVIDGGYDVRSGALAVADDRIKMILNEYGEYESVASDLEAYKNPKVVLTSAMSDESPDEDEIGKRLYANTKGIRHDSILGHYLDTYAGYVSEGDFRKNASSGGIATWLTKELLERKLIDGVIHLKQANDEDGVIFKYGISTDLETIKKNSKSRYYPGEFSNAIKEAKKRGGRYAIVGIPSFIMEIRLLAEQDPKVKEVIAFTIGLICGHQKSTHYSDALAWQHGIKPGDLKKIDYRLKVDGQPSSRYISEFIGLKDGKEVRMVKDQDELFVSNWGHGQFKTQFSDYSDDAFGETADITLGDAWLPEYTKDSKGTNVIVTRNQEINNIITQGIKDGKLHIDYISAKKVISSQAGLVHHMKDELPYRLELKKRAGQWHPKKRHQIGNISRFKKAIQKLRIKIRETSREEFIKSSNWNEYFSALIAITNRYNRAYRYQRIKKALMQPHKAIERILNRD